MRTPVLEARLRLAEGRDKLRLRHERGSPGIQVCRAMTDVVDGVVLGLYQAALADLGENRPDGLDEHVVLVAHGGFGRRDLAPYSDVDLMILHSREAQDRVAALAERLLRDVFDVGLVLGQSVRTVEECVTLARSDATICTALMEARRLAGSEPLFARFERRYAAGVRRQRAALERMILEARDEERTQFGETVHLLEPNIKRSRGGLRDLQLLRWLGYLRCSTTDPDGLRLRGELLYEETDVIQRTLEFLLRLRNELHHHAGKSNDLLDRAEQWRIAEAFGYQAEEGLLAVEKFMREYFRLTTAANAVVERYQRRTRRRSLAGRALGRLLGFRYEGDFRVEPGQIVANRHGLEKLRASLDEVLRLADLANLLDKPVSPNTWESIRAAAASLPAIVGPEAARRFVSLLDQPARLGELLRQLHDLGLLEKIVPAFAHARSLLQFNEYHKYTVDEHSLRAVEAACEFRRQSGPLGRVYRGLKRKWLLHLALLLHDLGKGYAEDHSDVGQRIAEETALRLGLSPPDTDALKFLVHKHLMMSHLAFRRDINDDQLIVRFAVDVGSVEVLQMLYLLSAADLEAVGPGVLNAWKVEVLTDLYHRAFDRLSGDPSGMRTEALVEERRVEVLRRLGEDQGQWFERHLSALPGSYLTSTPVEQVANDLKELRGLGSRQVVARGTYLPESNTTEYRVGTYEEIVPGAFHRLCGALSSKGLEILSAEINTLFDGMIFDRFFVADPDYAGPPPESRIAEVCEALQAALRAADGQTPSFRRVWQSSHLRRASDLAPLPTRVRVDNSTSDRYTVLDIFAADRMGLLFVITRTLYELGLSVAKAKIGTYLDQVVDVFYVTDQSGRKIDSEARLGQIRQALLERIEAHARAEAEKAGSL